MESKFLKKIIEPYLKVDLMAMLALSFCVLWFNLPLGVVCLIFILIIQVFHDRLAKTKTLKEIDLYQENLFREKEEIKNVFIEKSPFMLCVIDMEGELLWANSRFNDVFESEDAFYEKVDKNKITEFFNNSALNLHLAVDDKVYRVTTSSINSYDGDKKMLFWSNVTGYDIVKNLYNEERSCIALINIDNYDDLIASSPVSEQSTISAEIDKRVRTWAQSMNASIFKTQSNRYAMIFENKYIKPLVQEKFTIINQAHEIETKADFPTSFSIGIGVGARALNDLQTLAADAMDLALGRGGDQVVIKKHGGDIEFYGGALVTVEKRNKGKSRIMAHALQQLISSSDRVIIMGHKRADMDCFGAAVGVYHMAKRFSNNVDIVLDHVGEAIESIYEAAVNTQRFTFLTCEHAMELVTKNTLLVVVDTHLAHITECPEVLKKTEKVVVIDHHRRSKDAIENPTLAYMEVYASSTSELITELLQYSGDRNEIGKFEAEALLAGITVDTKNFSVNTGVRTFEAASWLKRSGADIANVRSFFKIDLDFFQKKVNLIASAEILENGVAVAYTKEYDPAMQILTSQVADELLDMKGVQAAFVAGLGKDATMLSGRSLGQLNVQTIAEKLGGGGHLTKAGAQLDISPEEAIHLVVKTMRDMELL